MTNKPLKSQQDIKLSDTKNKAQPDMPENVKETVQKFDEALEDVEKFIRPLLQQNFKEVQSQLQPLQRAKLNMCAAYTVNTLFYLLLKSQGVNPHTHPVKKEIQRIQEYMKKIKNKQTEDTSKRKLQLNKSAAQRFIAAALRKSEDESSTMEDSEMTDAVDEQQQQQTEEEQAATSQDKPVQEEQENVDPAPAAKPVKNNKRKRANTNENVGHAAKKRK